LVGPPDGRRTGTRLARILSDGLALWDKHAHGEVILTTADLATILTRGPLTPPLASLPPTTDMAEASD
jgi:hypothetical protein